MAQAEPQGSEELRVNPSIPQKTLTVNIITELSFPQVWIPHPGGMLTFFLILIHHPSQPTHPSVFMISKQRNNNN